MDKEIESLLNKLLEGQIRIEKKLDNVVINLNRVESKAASNWDSANISDKTRV